MYRDLDGMNGWTMNKRYFNDRYGYRQNNLYSSDDCSPPFKAENDMFRSDETKDFVSKLTDRDCSGDCIGAPSYYEPGHHSLPHTDHIDQRTVAYVCYSHYFPWWY